MELVKTLLTHKDLLNPQTRVLACKVIDKVVAELKEKLKVQVESAITGALRRDRHSPRRVWRNLDLKTTLRRNLKNFDPQRGKLLVDQLFFFAAERKRRPWHIIVTVDQSGSMLDSAIFSAVMASIFAELPAVRTSLVLFDTQVVDLSGQVGQPVDVLLSIQLGGGTDITAALQYAQSLVREPARSIVVLITDFYEGRDERDLVRQVRTMSEAGVRMIGLGALGYDARPEYNKATAGKLRKVGMDILVCTPERLAECMAQIIRG
jgi:Mg-chelatase subunit ChlD